MLGHPLRCRVFRIYVRNSRPDEVDRQEVNPLCVVWTCIKGCDASVCGGTGFPGRSHPEFVEVFVKLAELNSDSRNADYKVEAIAA
jgi:hypothetical protein